MRNSIIVIIPTRSAVDSDEFIIVTTTNDRDEVENVAKDIYKRASEKGVIPKCSYNLYKKSKFNNLPNFYK